MLQGSCDIVVREPMQTTILEMKHPVGVWVLSCAALLLLVPKAAAQRGLSGQQYDTMPFQQPNLYPAGIGPGGRLEFAGSEARPKILLTGYWPLSNHMLRAFNADPAQNSTGWVGSNWEGRGYDVYAYFAEFAGGGGQGSGDLQVDYQDTSEDFWRIADELKPIAVITFSRGFANKKWELEWNNRNLAVWMDDFTPPLQPTPAPPDGSVPAGHIRNSTLPLQKIVDAVNAATLQNIDTVIDFAGNGGGYLSEFIAYQGVWYQAEHADPQDPAWCIAAGHVHVGSMISLNKDIRATHQTLRALIRYIDEVTDSSTGDLSWFCPTTPHSAGAGAVLTAIGSQSITANDLELKVIKHVPGTFGLVFYGAGSQASVPFGDGQRCVSAPLFRISPVAQADALGVADIAVDFTSGRLSGGAGQVSPGSLWHFQYWMRDQAAGGAGFTASSGLSLTFTP